jgi:hypothetical protein
MVKRWSFQISHGARASQMVVDGSKRLHLCILFLIDCSGPDMTIFLQDSNSTNMLLRDVGSKLRTHESGTDVGLSQDLFSKSFEPDLNCSVVLDTDSFTVGSTVLS